MSCKTSIFGTLLALYLTESDLHKNRINNRNSLTNPSKFKIFHNYFETR